MRTIEFESYQIDSMKASLTIAIENYVFILNASDDPGGSAMAQVRVKLDAARSTFGALMK